MALTDSLISYWKCDESSGDLLDAHSTNDLTDVNTVGTASGIINTARDFTRSNSEYFSHSDNADFSFADEDFSLSFWVYFDLLPPFLATQIIGKTSSVGSNLEEYGVYYTKVGGADELRWKVRKANFVEATVAWGTSLSTSTWYHIVATHDSTANQIAIIVNDGTPATQSYSGGCNDGSNPFQISFNSTSVSIDGRVDEVGLWGKVLSSSEITQLYNSGSGLAYPFTGGAGGAGPIFKGRALGAGRIFGGSAFAC